MFLRSLERSMQWGDATRTAVVESKGEEVSSGVGVGWSIEMTHTHTGYTCVKTNV